ncbi:hypothetical protein VNO77_37786 [Canavalia gladiata]|uniref:Uncharacterized protein n=1 Tax=Canavalia gladiata TaxID=3824 RepID=A0AAN9K981_CANGL
MTVDEVSMERSKSLVNTLHELKNLWPRLYSVAEYYEGAYLHSEQKPMVPDNLKDYVVRVLMNAADHLGTVAIGCINYMDLKTRFSPPNPFQTRTRFQSSCIPVAKILPWHSAPETNSALKGSSHVSPKIENPKFSTIASGVFHFLDNEESIWMKSSPTQIHFPRGTPASSTPMHTLGGTRKDTLRASKSGPAFRSFDNPNRRKAAQFLLEGSDNGQILVSYLLVI